MACLFGMMGKAWFPGMTSLLTVLLASAQIPTILARASVCGPFLKVAKYFHYINSAQNKIKCLLACLGRGLTTSRKGREGLGCIQWAQQYGTREAVEWALEINSNELHTGGPQARPMSKARFTAFLLREIYEGNVKDAQRKIFNEVKSGNSDPYIAPGVREIVGYDKFNENDVKNNGFPPRAWGWLVPSSTNRQAEPVPAQHHHGQGRQDCGHNQAVIDESEQTERD